MVLATKHNANVILKKYLSEHGITQRFVAQKAGLSDQQLSDLVKGKRRFTADKAVIIANVLGVPSSIFLNNTYTK